MRSLEFDPEAFEDLKWWAKNDRKGLDRIFRLITDLLRDPTQVVGKPELLKGNLAGCRSLRINKQHRLVYKVTGDRIRILQCRQHY